MLDPEQHKRRHRKGYAPKAACAVLGFCLLLPGFTASPGWAWCAWHDWKNRPPRNRKKALKALGGKALARLKALKKTMPRIRVPVLKPVPA